MSSKVVFVLLVATLLATVVYADQVPEDQSHHQHHPADHDIQAHHSHEPHPDRGDGLHGHDVIPHAHDYTQGKGDDSVPDVTITDDEPEVDHSQIPHIDPAELDAMDHKELIAFCKILRNKYAPLLKHKFEDTVEGWLMSHAATLGQWLHEARHKHKQKDHQHFDCEEANDVLSHSAAKQFMETYEKFATKNGPDGMNNLQVIEALKELRKELHASHLVNMAALHEVDDAILDLEHLSKWWTAMEPTYKNIVAKKPGCEKDYQAFLKELHDITTDKAPDWEHIHQGVSSLVRQCEEDEEIASEL